MTRSTPKGAIAAGHRLTAEAAATMLRQGGNAIDAAIAALAMSCLCEPVLSSPGGGGFAMVRKAAKNTLIDFFPQTPLERRQLGDDGVFEILADFGTATQKFHIGPATAATPGFFAGIEALHKTGATMSLADLFAPTIKAARDGIEITPYQHYLSNVVQTILAATDKAARLFVPDGSPPAPGDIFKNPGLGNAFEIYCLEGFENSEIGQAVIDVQRNRGHLTAGDLATYRAIEREPLEVKIGAARVLLNPLPAASGTLMSHSLGHLESNSALAMAKALFTTGKARHEASHDLSKLITAPIRQRGTTHVSVIDAMGNACAVTVSNGEGNGEIVGDFGFMLNNILGEEDVNPHGSQDWPVNARLASMMCPSLIEMESGELVALGSGGSNRIRSALCQIIMHHCLDGVSLKEAIARPRLHIEGDHLDFEDLYDAQDRAMLCKAFPNNRAWPETNMFFGGVHAVAMTEEGRFHGVGDRRRDGVAVVVD